LHVNNTNIDSFQGRTTEPSGMAAGTTG